MNCLPFLKNISTRSREIFFANWYNLELDMNSTSLPEEFRELYEQMPVFVDRKTASKLSGGLTTPSSLATADCLGLGPGKRFISGKKVFYPRYELCRWLADRGEMKLRGNKS
jgi:hypothetical protein